MHPLILISENNVLHVPGDASVSIQRVAVSCDIQVGLTALHALPEN
jgi:hypothetical protein